MFPTVRPTAVNIILALLVCFIAVECEDEVFKVRAMLVKVLEDRLWTRALEDLKNLILSSDITLLMWDQEESVATLESIKTLVNNAATNDYSLEYSDQINFPFVRYAFYYQRDLFDSVSVHDDRHDGRFKVWRPFVVSFNLLALKSLTLAAFYSIANGKNMPSNAKQQLSHHVRAISADGNPFALIGKFSAAALDVTMDDLGRREDECLYTRPPGVSGSCVGPALLLNRLEKADVGNLGDTFKMQYFIMKPLYLNIPITMFFEEPMRQDIFSPSPQQLLKHSYIPSSTPPRYGIGTGFEYGARRVRGTTGGGELVRGTTGGDGRELGTTGGGELVRGTRGGGGRVHGTTGGGGRIIETSGGGGLLLETTSQGGHVIGTRGGGGRAHGNAGGGGRVVGNSGGGGLVRGIRGGGGRVLGTRGGGGLLRGTRGGNGNVYGGISGRELVFGTAGSHHFSGTQPSESSRSLSQFPFVPNPLPGRSSSHHPLVSAGVHWLPAAPLLIGSYQYHSSPTLHQVQPPLLKQHASINHHEDQISAQMDDETGLDFLARVAGTHEKRTKPIEAHTGSGSGSDHGRLSSLQSYFSNFNQN